MQNLLLLPLCLILVTAGCENKESTNTGGSINDPYFRADPGDGPPRIPVAVFTFDNDIEGWDIAERANDGRIRTEGGIRWAPDPFGDGDGKLMITCNFDGISNAIAPSQTAGVNNTMDGVPLLAPFAAPVVLTDQTFIEFDLYYPMDSNGKIMRIEVWSTSTGGAGNYSPGRNKTQVYVRPESLQYLNGPVAGEYNGQTYRVKKLTGRCPVSEGSWADLRFDIHGENATAWESGILFIDNVTILQQGEGDPIPPTVNLEGGAIVPSFKEKFAGKFLIGTTNRSFDELTFKHFNVITPGNSLKAQMVHPNPPQWLLDATGHPFANSKNGIAATPEYTLDNQGVEFGAVRDTGFFAHGHVLAWYTQGASWMRQIIPLNVTSAEWNPSGLYYAAGNNSAPPFFPVNKELARRAYYNHILHELRYFMTEDPRYAGDRLNDSDNTNDGIIPFISFDVLNEEIHETRHESLISSAPKGWKNALRNTSWLMAMTDNDYGDTRQHFVYLLFKFAHIAIPNTQMAAQYKKNYASLPAYMKADGYHDDGPNGIDAFISNTPPRLFYNDYDLYLFTKSQVAYNMIRDLNLLWKEDPLYDGRLLIEGVGIQGHDSVSPTLAVNNERAIALFAGLIDEGLLGSIAISELDLCQPDRVPGGAANSVNGDILNQKQADAIAYQFALLFKVYARYSRYIERITFWGSQDPGWGGSYKPFDFNGMAAPAYYAIMDPDRFIKGHSYLDGYFSGE